MKIITFNLKGEEGAKKDLDPQIFETSVKDDVIAQALRAQATNCRQSIASTKDRGEVSGGGRKPFKQKGTGNARAGSTRSPLWSGGGITFGPNNKRNFHQRINKKMNNLALRALLSEKIAAKKLIVVDDLKLSKISTKQVYGILSHLPIEEGKILVILPEMNVNAELSFANIPYAKTLRAENINIFDLLKHDYVLTTTAGIEKIEQILDKEKAAK